jgi:hypothetical protein
MGSKFHKPRSHNKEKMQLQLCHSDAWSSGPWWHSSHQDPQAKSWCCRLIVLASNKGGVTPS